MIGLYGTLFSTFKNLNFDIFSPNLSQPDLSEALFVERSGTKKRERRA